MPACVPARCQCAAGQTRPDSNIDGSGLSHHFTSSSPVFEILRIFIIFPVRYVDTNLLDMLAENCIIFISELKIKLFKITRLSGMFAKDNDVKTNVVSFIMAEHNKDYNCEMPQTFCCLSFINYCPVKMVLVLADTILQGLLSNHSDQIRYHMRSSSTSSSGGKTNETRLISTTLNIVNLFSGGAHNELRCVVDLPNDETPNWSF